MNENPWKVLASKLIYKNPWIKLTEHDVINPGGGKNLYGVVEFQNFALGIIPVDEEGNTWLVGQYRFPLDEYSWEIPMGGGPITNDILDSAKRELLEETGIKAREWDCISKIHTSNSVTNEIGYIFLARGLSYHEPEHEETELIEIKKLKLEEAYNMVLRNEITDSISVAGILKAKLFLEGQPEKEIEKEFTTTWN